MRNKKGLTGSMLKIIAMISMLIDHTAYTVLGTILVRNGINSVKNCSPEYMINMIEGGSIGRKLDFIAQEMNREANTILSKANDLRVSNCAIELKTEIEKVREQIQNIE